MPQQRETDLSFTNGHQTLSLFEFGRTIGKKIVKE
jgi:hypothetical protein